MRVLQYITATGEQLKIISNPRAGVEIIRGAAGSGKTTTAILRLRLLLGFFLSRRKQTSSTAPVRVLVLTYNRTLRGYITELINQQTAVNGANSVEVETFAHWAKEKLGVTSLISDENRATKILELGAHLGLGDFLISEVEYILSRYLPADRSIYLTSKREGRGASPRVDKSLRGKIINDVITPYEQWKRNIRKLDWFDLETEMIRHTNLPKYDIVIADEVQDFSANQIRAILAQVEREHAVTLVLDGAQRIYARGFTWTEVGITVTPTNSFRLEVNYRNTKQIASFASPLVQGLAPDDADSTMPDFNKCTRIGPKPIILRGKFSPQINYCIKYIKSQVDLRQESVAFLHPKGWFDTIQSALLAAGLTHVSITRQFNWPSDDGNIALSTIHSAKGLEFDHVIMIGLNNELLPHGADPDDSSWIHIRRLLAMGIGRAKTSVILGFKPDPDNPAWFSLLQPATYTLTNV